MKIEGKNRKKVIGVLILTLSLLVLLGYFTYTSLSLPKEQTPTKTTPRNESTDTDVDKTTDNPTGVDREPGKPAIQHDGPTDSGDSSLTGVLNYAAVSGDTLSIRTTIYQALGSGTCTLTLTHSETKKTVQKTVQVIPNPSSSTCNGFDLSTVGLSKGTWHIAIKIDGEGKSGMITGNVTI